MNTHVPNPADEPSNYFDGSTAAAEVKEVEVKNGPAKAVVGAVIATIAAGLGGLYTALSDNVITAQEWVGIAVASVGALSATGLGVYYTRNSVTYTESD